MTDTAYADLAPLLRRMSGDEKHDWSALSTLDVLWVLYDRVLRVPPDRLDDPDRDRFLLSKGHGPMAFYAVLAAKGFLDPSTLDTWAEFGSPLGRHPDRVLVPGAEIGSGSLGHGLAIGVGQAFGVRSRGAGVVVLVGDGELDEGSNHEAIAVAGRFGLDNLTAVVVDNHNADHGWPGGIETRFTVENWASAVVPGRDHDALHAAFTSSHPGRPLVVVADIDAELEGDR
ncbi:thiamine pyrophosphate-dependent enzyme [Actinokineospora sp. NBRC 105648]|uniref:thiamine pyrophosphate-dependent enzyme n=1 Tax=Actinokineospora sp. NBRC 105648 TaxID=3032206 RepID=UPI0024A1063C|nr:thiamine pyrophosphate-dependent enzyme [Actinokineospora sp. NBRC 105648]GLZ39405.1 transketolase [Actinokineospora sp. NBRC 105648]